MAVVGLGLRDEDEIWGAREGRKRGDGAGEGVARGLEGRVQDGGGAGQPGVQEDVVWWSGGEGEKEGGVVVEFLDCERHFFGWTLYLLASARGGWGFEWVLWLKAVGRFC